MPKYDLDGVNKYRHVAYKNTAGDKKMYVLVEYVYTQNTRVLHTGLMIH